MTAAEKLIKDGYSSFTYLALIKPCSDTASRCRLTKPSYGILEFSRAFCDVRISFGFGGTHEIKDASELDDLILLKQFSEGDIEELFYD